MGASGFMNLFSFARIFGLKRLGFFYRRNWVSSDLPVTLPVFGLVSHKEELLNIRDNILQGSIRDQKVEEQIAKARRPVIVDCGINVGITVRWWFYLNPQATVYGIDMMKEANDFAMKALPDCFKVRFVPVTAALTARSGGDLKICYEDPLFGGNSIDNSSDNPSSRRVPARTLDDCLRDHAIEAVDLLKVDIEGSAAGMFEGAHQTLAKVKNILIEMHGDKERGDSIRLLSEKGFRIRKSHKRHVWLGK